MLVLNDNAVHVIIKPYDRVHFIPTPKSEPIEKVYRLKRDDHSNSIYVEVGEKNIDEYINSFAAASSLVSVLSRISLLSAKDKISYLQQTEGGISADMTAMPTDATSAFIAMNKYKDILPQIGDGLRKGLTLDAVLSSIFTDKTNNITQIDKTTDKEITVNGET